MSERTLSDLEVYQHLTRTAEELEALAGRTATLIGGTALRTAAQTIRGMATAVYEHSLSEPGGGGH
ncbi:hypothetical protein [Phenylobacterium sp.]|uniref:hypothetical protein n=1 Tax=Phenylobacterium sp. TaxID=1871053 RepID=UPI002C4DF481|nr:hypothetical protein [Phenylobacterium sp.]HVI31344.1 hypothetical protein [Phenylobacterium sp.]